MPGRLTDELVALNAIRRTFERLGFSKEASISLACRTLRVMEKHAQVEKKAFWKELGEYIPVPESRAGRMALAGAVPGVIGGLAREGLRDREIWEDEPGVGDYLGSGLAGGALGAAAGGLYGHLTPSKAELDQAEAVQDYSRRAGSSANRELAGATLDARQRAANRSMDILNNLRKQRGDHRSPIGRIMGSSLPQELKEKRISQLRDFEQALEATIAADPDKYQSWQNMLSQRSWDPTTKTTPGWFGATKDDTWAAKGLKWLGRGLATVPYGLSRAGQSLWYGNFSGMPDDMTEGDYRRAQARKDLLAYLGKQ